MMTTFIQASTRHASSDVMAGVSEKTEALGWDRFLTALTQAVPACSSSVFFVNPAGDIRRFLSAGLLTSQVHSYADFFSRLDPLHPRRTLKQGILVEAIGCLKQTPTVQEYRRNFLERGGVGDVMEVYLRDAEGKPFAGISLMRSINMRKFSEHEVASVRSFHPLLELSAGAIRFVQERKPSQINYEAVLTPREQMLLRYLMQGLSNADIANKLFISIETVKSHCKNIYSKVGVANRVELLSLQIPS